jgi:tRNA threonylcarbamoyladenosine biosynthesis protein TsaE
MPESLTHIITHSAEETARWAEQFCRELEVPAIIALVGDLGAGKTVIAKAFGRELGIKEAVISPTFNYVLEYQGRVPLYHADLYRIEDVETFLGMGLDEYFDRDGIFLIEWAERVKNILPANTIWIELTTGVSESERQIKIVRGLS